VIEVNATGETVVPGLFAAGNVTDPSQQVLHAAADGSRVGAMISFSLANEDLHAARRPSANQADWDHRYGGDQLWSGNPNGTLVNEVGVMTPGRALDVGAGEGGDAVWLAEQGWTVTANDISQRALDRVAAEAARRGCVVTCQRSDANALDAFGAQTFDLVSAQYASIPPHTRRTCDGQPARCRRSRRHAAGGEPRRCSDARTDRHAAAQPDVRPGCVRPRRRHRTGACRRPRMGRRRLRQAATTSGRGLVVPSRGRRRPASPSPTRLTLDGPAHRCHRQR
jgi:hypothetical protein